MPENLTEENFQKYATDITKMQASDFFAFFETYIYGSEITDPIRPIESFPYMYTCVVTRRNPSSGQIVQEDPIIILDIDEVEFPIKIPWKVLRYAFELRFPDGVLSPETIVKVALMTIKGGIIIQGPISLLFLLGLDQKSIENLHEPAIKNIGASWDQTRLQGLKTDSEDILPNICYNLAFEREQLLDLIKTVWKNSDVTRFVDEVWFLQLQKSSKGLSQKSEETANMQFWWQNMFHRETLRSLMNAWIRTLRLRRCSRIGEYYFLNNTYEKAPTPYMKWATFRIPLRKTPFSRIVPELPTRRPLPERTKKQEKAIQTLLNTYEKLLQESATFDKKSKSLSLEKIGKQLKIPFEDLRSVTSWLCENGELPTYIEGEDIVFNFTPGIKALYSLCIQPDVDFPKITKNIDALINTSSLVLKCFTEKNRYPNRAETWKLGVGIEILDFCSILVNLPVQDKGAALLTNLTTAERTLLDEFSREFLKRQSSVERGVGVDSDEITLPRIMEIPNINIIFAKLLVPFINAVLESDFKKDQVNMPFIETEFSYFNFKKLDAIATRAIAFKAEHPEASLINLCVSLDLGIWTIKLALFFYEFILQNKVLSMTNLMKEKDFKQCAEKYREALVQSYRKGFPLTIDTLVKNLGNSFLDAKIILEIHQSNPTIQWTDAEIPELNVATQKLAKYLEKKQRKNPDQAQQPSITELVAELDFSVDLARKVIPFLNDWMGQTPQLKGGKFQFNSETASPDVDQLARNIITSQRKKHATELNYLAIMAEFDVGIIEVRSALDYYRVITEEYQPPTLDQLLPERIEVLDGLLKNVLITEGSSKTLTSEQLFEMNFTLRNSIDILAYYRQVREEIVDYKNGPIAILKKYDQVAREIFNAKEAGKYDAFDLPKVLAATPFTFRDTWHGLLFLKSQVMPEISSTAPLVQQVHAKVALQSNPLTLKVATAEEPAQVPVELLKGKVDIPRFQVKVDAVSPPINPGATIKRQYEYIGGKVRVKAKISNSGLASLLRVRLALDVPPSFQFLRAEPIDYDHEGPAIKVQDLLPGEEKAVAWVLEPMICGKERIGGSATGVDAQGNPFAVGFDPLEIEVKCPLFATPDEVNLPAAKKILEDLAVRNQRVFLLPETLSEEDALAVVTKVISERDVRRVGETAKGAEKQAWFYGVTKVGKKRFIFIAGASKAERTIRVATACDDEAGCTGFLAETGASIRRELVRRGAVDSEDQVVELICEQCGATLPRAPAVGVDVPCPECKRVWKVTDIIR